VSDQLLTVKSASAALGSRAASFYQGDDREVWLVLVHGSYTPSFRAPRAPIATYDHYYVVIDATTGTILSTGSPADKSW
jgi:hypothetical protein